MDRAAVWGAAPAQQQQVRLTTTSSAYSMASLVLPVLCIYHACFWRTLNAIGLASLLFIIINTKRGAQIDPEVMEMWRCTR